MRHLTGMTSLQKGDVDRLTAGAAARLRDYLARLPSEAAVDYGEAIGRRSPEPRPPRPDEIETIESALAHAKSSLDQTPPRKPEARAFLDRALELDRAGGEAIGAVRMTQAAGLYRKVGAPEKALRCAEGVIRGESRRGEQRHARTSAAASAMDMGDPDAAAAFLQPVLDRFPDDQVARRTLSRLRAMQGRIAEAIALRSEELPNDLNSRARASAGLDRELGLTQEHFSRHGDTAQAQRLAELRSALRQQT